MYDEHRKHEDSDICILLERTKNYKGTKTFVLMDLNVGWSGPMRLGMSGGHGDSQESWGKMADDGIKRMISSNNNGQMVERSLMMVWSCIA